MLSAVELFDLVLEQANGFSLHGPNSATQPV
jgi:hypothetical protein